MSIPLQNTHLCTKFNPSSHPSHQVPSICTLTLKLYWPPLALPIATRGGPARPQTAWPGLRALPQDLDTQAAPDTPPKTATPHPVLPVHRPGSPPLPPLQVCRLTLPPAPQPSPPGVRERVQPGSDIEQELHSLESTLPVNKKEGKKSH